MRSSVSKAAGAFVVAGAMAATMRVVRIKKTFPFVAIRPAKHAVQPPRSAAVGAVVHCICMLQSICRVRQRIQVSVTAARALEAMVTSTFRRTPCALWQR